ncbi:hypothetical protein Tco_1390743 [Tanacetum coccineum]
MEISIADQIALDDALVAPADRLKIGKCNLRLSSDVTSKEATLQMNNKKHILDLDQFRDIPSNYPKSRNQKFEEPPLEKEILAFLASLGHSGEIRKITDVNVNKLHQPWRSFAAIINKCLSGKPSYDSLRLSQAQILWGKIPPKTKGSKKKADTDTTTKMKPPTVPKEKKSGKGQQKAKELETISEAMKGTGVTPGVPDAPEYDSDDDISWKSSDDDQDDEKAQDDEDEDKNDDNETTQDDEDDNVNDDNETTQDDEDDNLTTHDDEIIHEEETDEDDTFNPIVQTPSRISSSDDEDSDNEVEGMEIEGTKLDDDATYVEDQGNEAVEDTNANLEGRNDVITDVLLPQVQATQEIKDTHVTLTLVNPNG